MTHNTILKYIALVKAFFNDLKITHKDDRDRYITRSIPMVYGKREKALVLDQYTEDQMTKGNTRVLPCGFITLEAFSKNEERQTNKNRTNHLKDGCRTFASFNSVPYDFIFSVSVRCRGASEAYQVVEQVGPMFNPTVNLDVYDCLYIEEPTRVAMTLDGIDVEAPEYEENSTNVYTVNISCTLRGWLYQPVFKAHGITNTIINIALGNDEESYASFNNFERITNQEDLKLNIIDIIRKDDVLTAIVDCDKALVVDWCWRAWGAQIKPDEVHPNQCHFNKCETDDQFTIELTLRDQFGRFTSMTKTFSKPRYV